MDNKEARRLMKLHNHKFGYCLLCGPMIICGYCDNNCCNAGSGDNCKDNCHEAYAIQRVVHYPWYYYLRWYVTRTIPMIFNKCIKIPISNYWYKRKK